MLERVSVPSLMCLFFGVCWWFFSDSWKLVYRFCDVWYQERMQETVPRVIENHSKFGVEGSPNHQKWDVCLFSFKARARIPPGLRKGLPMGGVVLSFRPSSFDNFYQNRTNMGPTSTTNGTNMAQGGQGVPEDQRKYEKLRKTQT